MTPEPETRAALPTAARGSAPGIADPAGVPTPVGTPAQSSGHADSPTPPRDRTPGPETRRPGRASVRAGDQTPAGTAPASPREADSAAPDRTRGYRGKDFTDAAKAEQSKQAKAARAKHGLYIPRARRGVQAASGPGMVRRMPPPQTPGDAA